MTSVLFEKRCSIQPLVDLDHPQTVHRQIMLGFNFIEPAILPTLVKVE